MFEFFFESKLNVRTELQPSILVDKQALSDQNARKRMQEQFKSNSARPMFSGVAVCAVSSVKVVIKFYSKECRGPPKRFIHMYILQVGRLKGVSFLSLDQSICCRLVQIDKFTRSVLMNTGSCRHTHLIPGI